MTRTRKLLLALALASLALAAIATTLVLRFDPNRYKSAAVDWMQSHYQRRLVLAGPIELHVFPRLEVGLAQVSLSEAGAPQQPFLQLEQARLAVQLWPLLSQQLVVDRIQASGLQLRYTRDAQGRRNIDDLLRPTPDEPSPEPGKPSRPMQLDISGIQLEKLQLSVDDAQAALRGQVRLTQLEVGRLHRDSLAPVTLAAQLNFQQPAAQVQLKGSLQLQLDLGDAQRAARIDARELDLHLTGALPGLPQIDTRLRGAAGYDSGSGELHAGDLRIDLAGRAGALQLADSLLSLERLNYQPAHERLELRALQIAVKGQVQNDGQAAQPLQASLAWPSLVVNGAQLSGAALSGSFALQGPAAVQGRIESGAPTGSFQQIDVPAFKLLLGGASGPSRMTGTVQADLALRPAERSLNLQALQIDAQVQNPQLRALAVRAEGQAQASPQSASWRLKGSLNQQAFQTEGQAQLGGPRPRLNAQATFAELDLDALLPPHNPAPKPGAAAAPGGAAQPAADAPIDLSALRSLDGRITVQAGTLRYAPYVLRQLKAVASLEDGNLDLNPLSLNTWGGTLSARVQASANQTQRLAVQAQAQQIDIATALKDVAHSELLEGRGQLSLDLRSSGRSVQALKAALAGQASLQLRDGAVRGFNLAQAIRRFQAALSLQQDAVTQARQDEKTDFSELSASFKVQQGIAQNNDLQLKSPFLRLGGEGAVNLPTGSLDYTARASVTNTSKGQGGADVSALYGVTVPVQLSGPFDAIRWKIQWSEVAAGAARNTVKQQLGNKLREQLGAELGAPAASGTASSPSDAELRQQARDKLKQGLKGLLR